MLDHDVKDDYVGPSEMAAPLELQIRELDDGRSSLEHRPQSMLGKCSVKITALSMRILCLS